MVSIRRDSKAGTTKADGGKSSGKVLAKGGRGTQVISPKGGLLNSLKVAGYYFMVIITLSAWGKKGRIAKSTQKKADIEALNAIAPNTPLQLKKLSSSDVRLIRHIITENAYSNVEQKTILAGVNPQELLNAYRLTEQLFPEEGKEREHADATIYLATAPAERSKAIVTYLAGEHTKISYTEAQKTLSFEDEPARAESPTRILGEIYTRALQSIKPRLAPSADYLKSTSPQLKNIEASIIEEAITKAWSFFPEGGKKNEAFAITLALNPTFEKKDLEPKFDQLTRLFEKDEVDTESIPKELKAFFSDKISSSYFPVIYYICPGKPNTIMDAYGKMNNGELTVSIVGLGQRTYQNTNNLSEEDFIKFVQKTIHAELRANAVKRVEDV